jgi:hypothetical protein
MNNSPIFSAHSRASVFTRSASWTCWGVAVVFSITLRNWSLLTQVMLPRSTRAWISFGSNGFAAILASELNGSPVAFAAEFRSRFLGADRLADQRKQERLRHAHDREFVVYVSGTVDASTGSDDTDTE